LIFFYLFKKKQHDSHLSCFNQKKKKFQIGAILL
jgi:hypothetical protein